jgi:hypothetical protein
MFCTGHVRGAGSRSGGKGGYNGVNNKKNSPLGFLRVAGLLLLAPVSCGLFPGLFSGEAPRKADVLDARVLPEPPARLSPEKTDQRAEAILLRGNGTGAGMPGFGENAFPVIYGEYGLSVPGVFASGEIPAFTIRISREYLYLPNPPWTPRQGVQGWRVAERTLTDSVLFAVTREELVLKVRALDDKRGRRPIPGEIGTLVFQFSRDAAGALGAEGLNRLTGVWLSRFVYFLTLPGGFGGFSLPAVLYF